MSNRSAGAAATKENFESYRSLLFSIAYRMLGSASEADDIVQEAYLRYHTTPAGEIRSLKSFLTSFVTNLSLAYLLSPRTHPAQSIQPIPPHPHHTPTHN